MTNSRGLFTVIGMLLGLGADQLIELGFGVYDRRESFQQAIIEQQHINIDRVIEVWNEQGNINEKAVFTAVLVQSGMVPASTACSLVAYALSTNDRDAVYRSLAATFPIEQRTELFASPECDINAYVSPTGLVEQSPTLPSHGNNLVTCPTGRLYTQFGLLDQISFGRQLQSFLTDQPFEITVPEHVDGFDARHAVIRYFDRDMETQAAAWHDYLEIVLPDIDLKYAFVPGFETALSGRDQFELWWPSSIQVPGEFSEAGCVDSG